MNSLRKLRLVAIDVDGVLIDDTYLAVIERFVTRRGGVYDEDAERRIVGLHDVVVGVLVADLCGLDQPGTETRAAVYAEREEYLREHPIQVADGAEEFLLSLRELGVRAVAYGGRTREHTFDRYLKPLEDLLDHEVPYVSINDHRPGVDWIVREVIGCEFDEAVFIDDVSRVGVAARDLGAGFIGFPSSDAHRRQRRFMAEAGVRHFASSLAEITPELLTRIDGELATSTHWELK